MSATNPTPRLFTWDVDFHNNACLSEGGDNWSAYARGYRDAADRLVRSVDGEHASVDTLVFPIAFLYRQYLELRLKILAKDASSLLDEDFQLRTTHNLAALWREARALLERAAKEAGENADSAEFDEVESLIAEFTQTDPSSTAFRYPVDAKGCATISHLRYINVRALKDEVDKIAVLLEGADASLSVWLDWKSDMLSNY